MCRGHCRHRPACLWCAFGSPRAPVAQLDRALPSEGRGRTFESCRVRHPELRIFCERASMRPHQIFTHVGDWRQHRFLGGTAPAALHDPVRQVILSPWESSASLIFSRNPRYNYHNIGHNARGVGLAPRPPSKMWPRVTIGGRRTTRQRGTIPLIREPSSEPSLMKQKEGRPCPARLEELPNTRCLLRSRSARQRNLATT